VQGKRSVWRIELAAINQSSRTRLWRSTLVINLVARGQLSIYSREITTSVVRGLSYNKIGKLVRNFDLHSGYIDIDQKNLANKKERQVSSPSSS
jgi:hypothetical protein